MSISVQARDAACRQLLPDTSKVLFDRSLEFGRLLSRLSPGALDARLFESRPSAYTGRGNPASRLFGQLRTAHRYNGVREHAICGQCLDWKQARWPDQRRGQVDLIAEMQQD